MSKQDGALKSDSQDKPADTERLAALGKFTAQVAHELNNPLDGILRYINLASRCVEKQDTERLNQYLDYSRRGLLRMVRIVGELLEFSRSRYMPQESIPLEHIIEDSIKAVFNNNNASAVKVVRNYTEDLPSYRADNLFQVFCNLMMNACDSMPDGGMLEIAAGTGDDGYVFVEFRDSGCGFDPEDAELLFEPFFTTKSGYKGTGLGLAICRDLVQRYGGRITAKNRPQGGSIFTVYVPEPDGFTEDLSGESL